MTVVIAFHCSDGVVIAADSMLTPNMGELTSGIIMGKKLKFSPGRNCLHLRAIKAKARASE
jgi:hypothetical protein